MLELSALIFAAASLRVTPSNCFEPCTVKYVVTVEQHEEVSEVCIHLEAEFSRSACFPPQRRTTNTQISNVPAGEYYTWLSVKRGLSKDESVTPQQPVLVIGEN